MTIPYRARVDERRFLNLPEPRMILEIADCQDRINLEFDVDSEAGRANSLHKLDTLIASIRVFRTGLVREFAVYDRRDRELEELGGE